MRQKPYFRTQISKVVSSYLEVWCLAKWARTKREDPREVPNVPLLVLKTCKANNLEKTEPLKAAFFPWPLSPEADLSNLEAYVGKIKVCPLKVTKQEVETDIRRPKADQAPDPDETPNSILQAPRRNMSNMLTQLFQACVEQAYHPHTFKVANMIVTKK